jgi:hypothetical protein
MVTLQYLRRSLSCQYLQITDSQLTNEISINQLIQIYRMAGTVSHSIGCRNAMIETLEKQAVQCRACLSTTEIQHCLIKLLLMVSLLLSSFGDG